MRRHVIFSDGTWKSSVRNPKDATNVEKLCNAVLDRDGAGIEQRKVSRDGVGTGGPVDRLFGGAFGVGLSREVRNFYADLVDHYDDGDELFLFGYSRGAYTVRSLAGLIANMSILRPEHKDRVDEAYAHYRGKDPDWKPHGPAAIAFRTRYSHPRPRVRLLGVWDTVGSLGVPTRGPLGRWTKQKYSFHDVELSGIVEHAYQALAIDEHRDVFAPAVWTADPRHAGTQHVEQVWFAGSHGDVGGGGRDCPLSDNALLWMMAHAQKAGLALDDVKVRQLVSCHDGRLNDSFRGIFRLRKRYYRPIDKPVPAVDGTTYRTFESLHPTVAQRHERCLVAPTGPYRPKNLMDYLQRLPAQPARPSTGTSP